MRKTASKCVVVETYSRIWIKLKLLVIYVVQYYICIENIKFAVCLQIFDIPKSISDSDLISLIFSQNCWHLTRHDFDSVFHCAFKLHPDVTISQVVVVSPLNLQVAEIVPDVIMYENLWLSLCQHLFLLCLCFLVSYLLFYVSRVWSHCYPQRKEVCTHYAELNHRYSICPNKSYNPG